MKAVFATVTCATLLFCCIATAQEVNGSLVANGKSAVLKYAVAQEVTFSTANTLDPAAKTVPKN